MPRKTKKKRLNAEEQIKAAEDICPKCAGNGTIRKNAYHSPICPICKGTGLSGKSKKRQKFNKGAKEKRTYNGVVFDSILEMRFAKWLDLLAMPKRKGFAPYILSWERQVPFDLWVAVFTKGEPPRIDYLANKKGVPYKYIIDFKVDFADRHTEYWEVKGWNEIQKNHPTLTDLSKLKIAIWKANNRKLAESFRIVDERDLPKGF